MFVPKNFFSAGKSHCIRCNIKVNEGLLYPLSKCFIFIHRPTIIIKFDDIDHVEFGRYQFNPHAATRNFDLNIYIKDSANIDQSGVIGKNREYSFISIDRTELQILKDFIESKNIEIVLEQVLITKLKLPHPCLNFLMLILCLPG